MKILEVFLIFVSSQLDVNFQRMYISKGEFMKILNLYLCLSSLLDPMMTCDARIFTFPCLVINNANLLDALSYSVIGDEA